MQYKPLCTRCTKRRAKGRRFVFTTVKELPITSVKNQSRAGTCWCYSSMAFLESELLRMGKGEYDFSEMYIVHQTYLDRADAAVRITEMYLFPKEDHSMTLSME